MYDCNEYAGTPRSGDSPPAFTTAGRHVDVVTSTRPYPRDWVAGSSSNNWPGSVIVASVPPGRPHSSTTRLVSDVHVPIGDHGVLSAGDVVPGAFDDRDLEAAVLLGQIGAEALARIGWAKRSRAV